MKTLNKLIAATMAVAVAAPVLSSSIFAADGTEGSDTTEVTYNNSTIIPDPDNPTAATWGVEIPKVIAFTDEVKKISADVKLRDLSADGVAFYPANGVKVTVKSANSFLLKLPVDGEKDDIQYAMSYKKSDGTDLTLKRDGTAQDIGTLMPTSAEEIKGTATMLGTATKTGNHSDTLTYTIKALDVAGS